MMATRINAHAADRETAGLTNSRVYRSTDAPNEIVVINKIADRQRAEDLAASNDVQSGNQRLGVLGTRKLYYSF
jgi:hypothetical protein